MFSSSILSSYTKKTLIVLVNHKSYKFDFTVLDPVVQLLACLSTKMQQSINGCILKTHYDMNLSFSSSEGSHLVMFLLTMNNYKGYNQNIDSSEHFPCPPQPSK